MKEELGVIAWHQTRMKNWYMTENEKKKVKDIFPY